jgi:hypothetical protein
LAGQPRAQPRDRTSPADQAPSQTAASRQRQNSQRPCANSQTTSQPGSWADVVPVACPIERQTTCSGGHSRVIGAPADLDFPGRRRGSRSVLSRRSEPNAKAFLPRGAAAPPGPPLLGAPGRPRCFNPLPARAASVFLGRAALRASALRAGARRFDRRRQCREAAKGLVGLRSGDGLRSVRVRPSSLKHDC